MTLPEVALVLVVIAIALRLLVGISEALVNEAATNQTRQTLHALKQAMAVYHQANKAWPSAAQPAHLPTPMARCLAALRSDPATAHMVTDLPGQRLTPDGHLTLVDGFANPMRYINASNETEARASEAHRFPRPSDARAFVVSPGPDGDFGNMASSNPDHRAAAVDNLDSF